ncbi:hypothetical protein EJ02DRAFT_403592 [Clathrospora elynae]|uniref:Mediator of RNA polymerase II transcription subunit 20 n=1 Tax=Clathrospora elynae TaxID=706981 RepID=A0A6A5SP06_9PLEO|nr:hypothetical protein EJ02DRAFT_403592 [Clathrospora elynae]
MKYSGLYFISNPSTNIDASLLTVNTLVQGIEASFQNVTRQGPWSLSYRSFRDTIPPGYQHPTDPDGKPKTYAHAYQHLLHLSSLSSTRTYACSQPHTAKGTVISIPLRQQDPQTAILRQQFSALWAPRHVFSIWEGASYSSGICTIQIGELRATREGPQSGAVPSPGVVVCITTTVGADSSGDGMDLGYTSMENSTAMDVGEEEVDLEYARTVIRDCWSMIKQGRDLGRSEVKEVMMAPTATATQEQERHAAVRMWCDALRMRG